jgi:hypothetical protein
MKRNNTPSTGASEARSSPGLTLDGASVWQKRDPKKPPPQPTQSNGAEADYDARRPTWNRYADSRLRQFHCR